MKQITVPKFSNIQIHLVTLLLCLFLFGLPWLAGEPVAQAASANLVWKPYLQQLTDRSVIILWATQTGTNPELRYSQDTSYGSTASGSSRPLMGTQLHRIELTDLQPDSTYYYKIYTEGEDLLPDELLSFQTAPAIGSDGPFTFVAMGDYGKNTESQIRLRDQLLLDSFRLLLTTGDNAYSDGTYSQFDTNVFQIYQDLFGTVGLFPTLGNHDYRTDNGAPYLDIFELPQQAMRAGDQERYYSFDFGNAHFVALDSNAPLDVVDSTAADDMFDWLRADLSQTRQPWRIVAMHHSAYSTGAHGSDSRVQAKLVPIFEAYGVDLVISGHDHIYQRSKPLRNGQITPVDEGGIIYLISGAGSAASYSCTGTPWLEIAYCSQTYGLYARLTLDGDSMTIEAIDDAGDTKDFYSFSQPLDVPLHTVEISGSSTGLLGAATSLMATAGPVTATLPITYNWQATAQTPLTTTAGLNSDVVFTWPTTGTQTITVTATNAWSTQTGTFTVTIVSASNYVYLPLIVK